MFCLPVPRDKFRTSTPWVLIVIAVVDALLLLPVYFGEGRASLYAEYAFIPAHPTWISAFTGLFLHVGILHYVGNMWFLWLFGRKIEGTLGHLRFAGLYLLSGFSGQLFHLLFNLHSNIPTVGASGAISGVAGAFFILFPRDRFNLHIYLGYWRVKTWETTTRSAVGAWIGEQLLLGLITAVGVFSSVAFWAHVGGFAGGLALGALYHSKVPVEERPEIPLVELALDADMIEQPSGLVSLNLNKPSES